MDDETKNAILSLIDILQKATSSQNNHHYHFTLDDDGRKELEALKSKLIFWDE
jgi:hypothetical protein